MTKDIFWRFSWQQVREKHLERNYGLVTQIKGLLSMLLWTFSRKNNVLSACHNLYVQSVDAYIGLPNGAKVLFFASLNFKSRQYSCIIFLITYVLPGIIYSRLYNVMGRLKTLTIYFIPWVPTRANQEHTVLLSIREKRLAICLCNKLCNNYHNLLNYV